MGRMQFSFAVEKADDNGYHAVLHCGDQQRTVCRTTLPEIVGWFADHAGALCKESPYLPPQPQPYKQAPMVSPAQEPDATDPELADKMAERFSFNGSNGRAVVAFAFCTLASIGMAASRFV